MRDLAQQNVILQRKMFWATVAIAVTTGIYVLVTVFLLLAARDQLGVMREQLKDARTNAVQSRKDTDRALTNAENQVASLKTLADANKTLADTSVKSLESGERALHVSERPWIEFDGFNDNVNKAVIPIGTEQTNIQIWVKNSGRSPALNVHLWACSVFAVATPQYEKCRSDRPDRLFIGAGSRAWVLVPVGPFSDERITALLNRTEHLWLLIRVTWADQFGARYSNNFCYVADPSAKTFMNCDAGKNPRQEQ